MVATKKKDVGVDLENIGDLSSLLNPDDVLMNILLSSIDEDPNQPRTSDNPGFAKKSLDELAATIKLRNVKTPISVRDNPDKLGCYIINHGARRYRSSIIAGKNTIPAFVDNDYLEEDQIIENLQRDDLTAREVADYIGRKLAAGVKKSVIAKMIGKSPAYITQHVTLLNLPDSIADAFSSGRINDVTVINELVNAYKKAPDEIKDWITDKSQEVTRGSVKLLKEFLEDKEHAVNTAEDIINNGDSESDNHTLDVEGIKKENNNAKKSNPNILKKPIVQIEYDGRTGCLILNKRPPKKGYAWIKCDDNNDNELKANLKDVTFLALIEG